MFTTQTSLRPVKYKLIEKVMYKKVIEFDIKIDVSS